MKFKFHVPILLCALLLIGGCGKTPPITSVPAVVAGADQDVKAGAAKALGILISAAKVANQVSLIETEASRTGVVPTAADAAFDKAMVAYTRASDSAAARITEGVSSWAQLKALVDPVLIEVNNLISTAQSLGAIRDRLAGLLAALKDVFTTPFSPQTAGLLHPVPGGAL
jgi:hypothetical protein